MALDPDRELVTIAQAVAILGVCRNTIYNWMRDGRIGCCRTAGGQPRIYADTLTQPYVGASLPIPKGAFTSRRG